MKNVPMIRKKNEPKAPISMVMSERFKPRLVIDTTDASVSIAILNRVHANWPLKVCDSGGSWYSLWLFVCTLDLYLVCRERKVLQYKV